MLLKVALVVSLTKVLALVVSLTNVCLQSSLSLGGCNRASSQLSGDSVARGSAVVQKNPHMFASNHQPPNNMTLLGLHNQQQQQQQMAQQLQDQSSNLKQLSLGINNGTLHPASSLPQGGLIVKI